MSDEKIIIDCCIKHLDLNNASLSDEYYYQSLSLCVIDAVFSIGVKYSSARNTVIRYCDYFNLDRIRNNRDSIPAKEVQQSISNFLMIIEHYGLDTFTEDIFNNRQRTSAVNGILKTKAVYEFSKVLEKFNVNYFQDIYKIIDNCAFEKAIKKIPGQKSGLSLNYFFMLAGFDQYIKPDRMVLRFLQKLLNRKVGFKEANKLLINVSEMLSKNYKNMSPKLLDHEIWKHEREF